jgi:CheY-like chemotaxis protein/MinD-like ATPase involved in chromosome partitioning or flagellar assembly
MDAKKRILVADDDPAARTLVRRRLEIEGYTVTPVEDGMVALAEIAREQPDLVILDIMMPRVDGVQVINDLRTRSETAQLPVILVSAQGAGASSRAVHQANAYFPKPIDFPAMISQIRMLLERPRPVASSAPPAPSRPASGPFVPRSPATDPLGGGALIGAQPPGAEGLVVFVGAKGGVGTTTAAAAAAAALARSGRQTVLAETTTFHGTLPTVLGMAARRRMDRLPLSGARPFDATAVANTLLTHGSGLRVMFGPAGGQAPPTADGLIALWDILKAMAESVVIDLGSAVDAVGQVTLRLADRIWVVTTPEPASVERAAALIRVLEQWGVRPQKIDLLVNQTNSAMVMEVAEIAQQTERAVNFAIPAAPEACFEATRRGLTLVELDPRLPAARVLSSLVGAEVSSTAVVPPAPHQTAPIAQRGAPPLALSPEAPPAADLSQTRPIRLGGL